MSQTHSEAVDHRTVAQVAAAAGIALDATAVARLAQFGDLFLAWNRRINLGGDFGAEELVTRHFLDSFVAAGALSTDARVVDVGSGGGLPALPLAIARPDLMLKLFEPTAKKVAFLRTAIRELGMGERVEVHAERLDLERPQVAGADAALSRATFPPATWAEVGKRLVRCGGKVLVFATDAGGGLSSSDGVVRDQPYAPGRRLIVLARPGDPSG